MIPAVSSATKSGQELVAPPGAGTGAWPAGDWRRELQRAVTDSSELLRLLDLDENSTDAVVDERFPLRVPRPFIARMKRGDWADPLLRQVLPTRLETLDVQGYGADPLHEAAAEIAPGVMKKYAGRTLLLPTGACAVHCRYCFRRHFPYQSGAPSLAAVREDASTREVILSGGDPLLLTDARLKALVADVEAIGHVSRLRIHTRLPVVIPQRVTTALVDLLTTSRLRVVVVLHINHGNEIDADCRRAFAALGGVTLLNQSVLLHGVNDDAATLAELSERLFDAGVLPYYLHMPDAVAGTAHFDVSATRAAAIHRDLTARLPGYLVPKLVREVPGGEAKTVLDAASIGAWPSAPCP